MNDAAYLAALERTKQRIAAARLKAVVAANRELVELYWLIGDEINRSSGDGFVKDLSEDLRRAMPEARGFTDRDLAYMARFAAACPADSIAQQLAAQLPWGHTMTLLDQVPEAGKREWYATQALEHGWSRRVLEAQIEAKLFEQQFATEPVTRLGRRLPPLESDLAAEVLGDRTSSASSTWLTDRRMVCISMPCVAYLCL